MVFKLSVSPRAVKEIEQAIEYYLLRDKDTAQFFTQSLESSFKILEINPFFEIQYKNVRMIPLKKFPYSLYFIINEELKNVRILSCFHQRRDPNKLP